jgi:small-conductance mechanosensitive channel
MTVSWHSVQSTVTALAILVGAGLLGLLLDFVLWRILTPLAERTPMSVDNAVVKRGRGPARLILPLLAMNAARPYALEHLGHHGAGAINDILTIGMIAAVAWLLIALVSVIEDVLLSEHRMGAQGSLSARKLYTQVQVLKRILTVIIIILAIAAMLMSFERFRRIGTGILASAGVAGIVLGFAAQKTLGNILAGFQIAISQPIRIDDVLVVEGEWGRVEEITLTYVVLRIWDLRRLIIPISYFLDKPFQNWTRTSTELLGTVYLYADYTLPVDALRRELHEILKDAPGWDGKAEGVQVTDAKDRVIEVRALLSASDSGKLWDLRCLVRERLVEFVRREYPQSLPRFRAEMEPLASGPGSGEAEQPGRSQQLGES